MKAVLTNQVGAQSRQVALCQIGKTIKKLARYNAVEDGIPKKLEALVMRCAVTAMGQRSLQQRRIKEGMAERLLESMSHSPDLIP